MDKKKSSRKPAKESTKKPVKESAAKASGTHNKESVKETININKIHLENLKQFACLVKEIIETMSDSKKGKKSNPIVEYANRYIKTFDTANCNISVHHQLYIEFYQKYKKKILKSTTDPEWMNELDTSINIQLGIGTPIEKKNVTLKISVACNAALKMRDKLEKGTYKNANDREEALGHYTYQFVDLFYYRLLTVIKDALGENHSDIKKLDKLISDHKDQTHLNESEDDTTSDSETGAAGIGQFLKNVTGGEQMSSKNISKAVESITGNKSVTDQLSGAFENIEKKSKNKETFQGKEMFASIMEDLAPALGGVFDALGGNGDKETAKETKVSVSSGSGSSENSEDSSD